MPSYKNFMGDPRSPNSDPRDPFINPDLDPTPNRKTNTDPETEPSGDPSEPKKDNTPS
jgi:hypothetical protein